MSPADLTSDLLKRIARAQRRRVLWLVGAHLPVLLCVWLMNWHWAVLWLLVLHLLLLWGTLNPHSALFGRVMRRAPIPEDAERAIWLTIDDGPSADTSAMLALLQRYQAKATFFLVAARARQYPEQVRAIVEAGHEIGNHSDSHPAAWFWCLLPARMTREISDAQQGLSNLTGKPPRWFRAVVGHTNPFVQPVLEVLQMRRVAWTARAYDAVDGDVQRVVKTLMRRITPGTIVLLHEGASHGHNVAMLEGLLQQLAAHGYQARLPS